MEKLNKQWHARNRMPKNATDQQRIAWHAEHAKHCRCRPIPEGVRALMRAKPRSGKTATRRQP